MDKETLNQLIDKVSAGTATSDEKLIVLKELNAYLPRLNGLLKDLTEAMNAQAPDKSA
jgi:hypothetical protein